MRWHQPAACRTALIVLVLAAHCLAQQAERFFKQHDRNQDGKLSREEFPQRLRQLFDRIDANGDGAVTLEEDKAFRAARRKRQAPGQGAARGRGGLPETVRVERDIPYAATKNPRQMLDLVLPNKPSGKGPLPVIAFIHGGGWRGGNKAGGLARIAPFVASGTCAGVSIGYRLSGEAIWPAQIHDCKAAIRWIRANAGKHNLDGERIGVWGPSAGGHLVAMLGTSGGVKALEGQLGPHTALSSRVACVADWFGPTDFCQMDAHRLPGSRLVHDSPSSPESLVIGGPIQKNREKVAQANPITYVTKDDPPFLIAHGTKDPLVPWQQSELLEAALRKAGCDVTFVKVVGAGHGGFRSAELDRRLRAFFDKHLRGVKADISAEPVRQGRGAARD
jgi:acetyl esterase/lipase